MKISVSSYSFMQYIRAGKMTQFETIAKAKELGFDAIEFTTIDGESHEERLKNAKKYREEAEKLGMIINAYTIGANLFKEDKAEATEEIERLKKELLVAKELGAPLMRHDVCYTLSKTGNGRSFDLMLPTIAKNARELTEYAQTLGIKTCSENHGFIAQDSDRVERLYNAVNHENYGLLVDMGNFACADENSATAVSRLAPYAIHAHAKDFIIRKERFGRCQLETRGCNYIGGVAVGEGDIPVKQCLAILKKAQYEGFLSIEYEGCDDCIDGIKRSLENLKKFLADLVWE